MTKFVKIASVLFISASVLLSGCSTSPKLSGDNDKQPTTQAGGTVQNTTTQTKPGTGNDQPSATAVATTKAAETSQPIDLTKVKPNENGKVMVLMFHNFVESFTPKKGDDGQYTTTFDEFRKLLQTLYDDGFRPISMDDYLNNNISVPAGYKPIVFTFDDGTAGQFNLADDNGKLIANKQSAVGIMEEFNKAHPDFGLKGVFYVNLNNSATFGEKGTMAERLKYLIDKGFEVGNHTLDHAVLSQVKTADKIQEQIGGNQKKMFELVPGYKMNSFALPEGAWNKELKDYIAKGVYQGTEYDNKAIMLVGAEPAFSPVSKNFNPLKTARVRATGMKQVDCDLAWWLKKLPQLDLYVSDGDPNTVTVPKSKEDGVDSNKLNGKKLITY